ncbi:hypothetical protein HNQ59_000712 [Chitinivorax tropicus]|uniref:DUF3025 domain-containing protein n=1 Tax=Chitinivorax tropicus TaxID=714531 RepID=A0A840MFK7_9PROT|nr:DUF3025 domain-containing protein [Chitinivorax tropicus]MBB5017448.1 hypothetical protein [Chitinivorax tropicus]
MSDSFSPLFLSRSPILDTLSWLIPSIDWTTWPTQQQLDTLRRNSLSSSPIPRFIYPETQPASPLYYEQQVFQQHEVPTRFANWHDLFNALCWLTFPHTKWSLNQRHIDELQGQADTRHRTRKRDAATLLDESGILLPYSSPSLIMALIEHDWHTLFVTRRAAWQHEIKPLVIGHAIFERAHQPFIGMTAKALPIPVEPDFFAWPLPEQLRHLDTLIAHQLIQPDFLATPKEMPPLPYLGIPGWHPGNEQLAFYQQTTYFRPRHHTKMS